MSQGTYFLRNRKSVPNNEILMGHLIWSLVIAAEQLYEMQRLPKLRVLHVPFIILLFHKYFVYFSPKRAGSFISFERKYGAFCFSVTNVIPAQQHELLSLYTIVRWLKVCSEILSPVFYYIFYCISKKINKTAACLNCSIGTLVNRRARCKQLLLFGGMLVNKQKVSVSDI